MSTTVATWGNSEAMRIPRSILKRAGLSSGDRVDFELNSNGHLEIVPASTEHRRIRPVHKTTFQELFSGYTGGRLNNADAWAESDDTPIGAEQDAWLA